MLTASFSEVLPHILPKVEAENELRRRDKKIYEITEVPPWVAFENLKESMSGLWKRDIELARVINRFRTNFFLWERQLLRHVKPLQWTSSGCDQACT